MEKEDGWEEKSNLLKQLRGKAWDLTGGKGLWLCNSCSVDIQTCCAAKLPAQDEGNAGRGLGFSCTPVTVTPVPMLYGAFQGTLPSSPLPGAALSPGSQVWLWKVKAAEV